MNIYERSYKRVRADGLSQPDLLETLRADGVFRAFAPLQQPLVAVGVAQVAGLAWLGGGCVRLLLTPDRLYLSVEVVLRRCAFETPASRYLFDALAQNAVRVSIDAAADGICLFAAIRNRDAEAEARAESYEPDELFLQMLQSFGEE